MSPRPKFVCAGNHADLTDRELTNHDRRYCKDELTAAGRRRHQNAKAAEKRANAETSDEAPNATAAKEGRGTPETGSEPATARGEAAPETAAVAPAEPTTAGEVDDDEAAHEAPEAIERPTAPAAPKPAPPTNSYMSTRMPARGTIRRLQALTTLGYTPKQIAAATGLTIDSVWWALECGPVEVETRTHAAVAAAFKRLKVTPLYGRDADRARMLAYQGKWAGAYDWEDIDRDAAPPHPTARKAWDSEELKAAVAAAALEQGELPRQVDSAELELANAARQRAEGEAAGLAGRVDGLNERLALVKGDLTAARDQLAAANAERTRLADENVRLAADVDIAADRIAELEEAGRGATSEYLAPVTHIDNPLQVTGVEAQAGNGPVLGEHELVGEVVRDNVTIIIERTDRGIHLTLPASLLDEGAR